MINDMFLQRCFIRCNSEGLRQKLIAIGYYICPCVHFEGSDWLNSLTPNGSIHGIGYIDKDMFGADWTQEKELSRFLIENDNGIDCGTNEELFLAIAALRYDNDYMQLFTNGSEWILCDREDWIDMISVLCCGGRYNYDRNGELSKEFYKATVQELINHFKEK